MDKKFDEIQKSHIFSNFTNSIEDILSKGGKGSGRKKLESKTLEELKKIYFHNKGIIESTRRQENSPTANTIKLSKENKLIEEIVNNKTYKQ
jgi:hypothetical protein